MDGAGDASIKTARHPIARDVHPGDRFQAASFVHAIPALGGEFNGSMQHTDHWRLRGL
jgi:hypothetical protein